MYLVLEKCKRTTRVQLSGVLGLMGDHRPSVIHWRLILDQSFWGYGGAKLHWICEKMS